MTSPDATGLPLLLSHALALVIAAAWLWLLTAAGRAVMDRAFPPAGGADPEGEPEALSRLLLDLAIGAGAAGTVLLGLGTVGLLRPWVVLAGAGGAMVALRGSLVATVRRAREAGRGVVADLRAVGILRWAWAPAMVLGVLALVMALAPVSDWDSLMYHLTVPARWLEAGRVHVPADNLHASRVGLLQVLFVVPLALGEPRAASLLVLGLAVALCAAVYAAVRHRFDARAAVFAGATLWATGMLWFGAVAPRNDVALAFFLVLAHDRLLRAMDRDGLRPLALTGVLLGLAVATKFQALPYAVALVPLAWWDRRRGGGTRALAVMARRLGTVAAAALVVAAPWLLKNLLLFGAPFYPLLAEPMAPPWVRALSGGGSPEIGAGAGQVIWQVSRPFNLVDFFLHPWRLNVESEAFFYRANFLLLALPLLALVRERRATLLALAMPALLYLAIVLAAFPRANLRYLLPALVVLGAVAAVVTLRVLDRLPGPRLATVVALAVGVAAVMPATLAARRVVVRANAHGHALGAVSRDAFLARRSEYAPLHMALTRLDSLPPDARVLMLYDARGFRASRTVIQDNKITNWPYVQALLRERDGRGEAGAAAAAPCDVGGGITHVLVNRGPLNYYLMSPAVDSATLGVRELDAYLDRCTRPVWDRAPVEIRALRTDSGPRTEPAP